MLQELENKIALCDINAECVELDNNSEIVSLALVAIEELSDIADIISEEDVSKNALQIATVATEAICNRLGYKPRDGIVASLEAYSEATRRDISKVSLEKISDTLMKIWEAIKNFFRRILDGIKSLWTKIDETIEVNDSNVKRIEERIAGVKEYKKVIKPNIEINVAVYCNAFNVTSADDIFYGVRNTLGAHADVLKRRSSINKDIEKLFKAIPDIKTTEEAIDIAEKLNPVKHLNSTKFASGLELSTAVHGAEGIVHITLANHKTELTSVKAKPTSIDKLERILLELKRFRKVVDEHKAVAKESEAIIKAAIAVADKLSQDEKVDYTLSRLRAKLFESGQESLLVISARIPKAGMWAYITGLSFINANLSCYIDPQ